MSTQQSKTEQLQSFEYNAEELTSVLLKEYIAKAKEFTQLKQLGSAILYYQKALSLSIDKPIWIYLSLASLLFESHQYDESIRIVNEAIKVDEFKIQSYILLGKIYEKKGDIHESIKNYSRVVEIDDCPPAWIYNKLANLLAERALLYQRNAVKYYLNAVGAKENFSTQTSLNILLQQVNDGSKVYELLCPDRLDEFNVEKVKNSAFLRQLIDGGFFDANNSPVNPSGYYLINEKLKMVYCSIPKNACTVFKNMLVEHSDLWIDYCDSNLDIHTFVNQSFRCKQPQHLMDCLHSDDYFKFVVLRHPFKRLVSAYLDKFAKHAIPETFVQDVIRAVQKSLGKDEDISRSISFSQFVDYLCQTPDYLLNDHWRPQINFVANVDFDYFGKFEEINQIFSTLENRFRIDVRKNISKHRTEYSQLDETLVYSDLYPHDLRQLKGFPDYNQLINQKLAKKIYVRYQKDIELYETSFETSICNMTCE